MVVALNSIVCGFEGIVKSGCPIHSGKAASHEVQRLTSGGVLIKSKPE